MDNQKRLAPIIVVLIVVALLAGGILIWQCWRVSKEEVKAPEVKILEGEIPGEKLEEVILSELPEGENKIDNIKIEKIKINSNSGLPKWIKVEPFEKRLESDWGYCIFKEGEEEALYCGSRGEIYFGYATFNYRESKYIIVTTLNTGTAGPIEIHFLFILDGDSKILTPIGDVKWGLFTSRDRNFSIIGYGDYLYFESHTRGHLSAGTYSEDVELLVIEKDTLRDEKSFHASNILLGYSFPIPTNLSTSLINKDGKLYAKVKNGYCYSIKRSPEAILVHWGIADEYYLLNEDGKLIESSFEFKNEYLKAATEYNEMLEKYDKPLVKYDEKYFEILEKVSEEAKSVIEFYYGNWLSPLLCRTLNYILAGQEEKAWSTFDEDFDKFSEEYLLEYPVGYSIEYTRGIRESVEITNPQELKQEIEKDLKEIAAANWKIYRNEEYGFEIKYPNNWRFESDLLNNKISITGETLSPTLIIQFPTEKYSEILAKEERNFNEWQQESVEQPSGKINNITFAETSAKEFLYYSPVGFIEQVIILSKNNQTVVIESFKNSVLDPILSTFKFIK